MIIIDSSLEVKIMKHISYSGNKTLVLTNNLTNENITLETSITEKQYFYLVNIPDVSEGEYTYSLMNSSNNIIETGLLYYGEINNSIKDYTAENKVYTYERK